MTILFFSRLFFPHIGGVEKHVMEISKLLIKREFKIIVVTELHDNKLKLRERINDITIYRIPIKKDNWFKKFIIWRWVWRHRSLLKSSDIIHCHDVFFWYMPFRFLYPSKKAYVTFHGYESYPIKKSAIVIRKLSEILANGNICIGDFMRKWYGAKPTLVSYGATTLPKNNSKQISNYSAVFAGRLDEQTGILTYLEAVRKIREKIPDFKFTVLGDGKFRKKIEEYADIRGFVKNPEKEIEKYNFVFASRYLSILEAMAAKKLVFAVYDNPVKKDYLKMSPFAKYIIIAKSSDIISDKVLYYLKNPNEMRNKITKSFNWVSSKSWDSIVKLYLRLW